MADDDRQLESVLSTSLRGLALHKGPCPPVERLLRYQAHELSVEAEGGIRAHLLACGHCEMLLLRIEGFAAAVATPEPSWAAMRRFLRRPLLGYALAAVLLVALVTRVGQKNAVPPSTRPTIVAESLPSFELPQTRGEGDFVVRPGGSEGFILRFFVPMTADGHYAAGIRDRTGREVVTQVEIHDSDGRGNVDLVCRANVFTTGSYVLTVLEKGSNRQIQYNFQVQ
jgi:hypothetical protein